MIMATKKTKALNLEKALVELEDLIDQMESEQLSLEESLKLFKKGVSLTEDCQKALSQAEQQVEQLTQKNKTAKTTIFELEE